MQIAAQKFSQLLLNWYDEFGRHELPWRQDITTYKVWVSEIMLQQTQVVTVIPYFLRFIQRFPTIETLATASVDEVLLLWAGLGYYSRGRNLHRCAQVICQRYAGKFPLDLPTLQSLPGIGRSTAGAILAISANQAVSILDGNVKRVLSRFVAVAGWPGQRLVMEKLWQLADYYTPTKRANDYTQALMDFGATICTRSKPKCSTCFLKTHCLAYQNNVVANYPEPKPRKQLPHRSVYLLLIKNDKGELLMQKRPPVGIWGGLWSLPECAIESDIIAWGIQQYGYQLKILATLASFRHTFSHYHLHITPVLANVDSYLPIVKEDPSLAWYELAKMTNLGLPKPVNKLINAAYINSCSLDAA